MKAVVARLKALEALVRAAWGKLPVFYRDACERVLWTAVQAGIGVAATAAAHVPVEYAAVVAVALAVVKATVARHIGDPETASTTV